MATKGESEIFHGMPLSVILQWPKPNYINPERRTWFPAFAITIQTFTTIFVAIRLYLRIRGTSGKFGLDDWLIIPGWLFSVLTTAAFTLGTAKYNYDRHIWDATLNKGPATALIGFLSGMFFMVATSLTKISILLFFRRMSAGSYNKAWKMATYGCIAFTATFLFAFEIAYIFSCRPVQAYWLSYDLNYKEPHTCRGEYVTGVLTGIFGVVTDMIAVIMPAILFWNLKMPTREKIALWSIFGIGILTVGAGIGRTISLHRFLSGYNHFDTTWYVFDAFVFSVLEMNFALFCASAPTLKAFFIRYLRGPASTLYGSFNSSKSKSATNNTFGTAISNPPLVVHVKKEVSQFSVSKSMDDNDSIFDLKVLTAKNAVNRTPSLPPAEVQKTTITSSIKAFLSHPGFALPRLPARFRRTTQVPTLDIERHLASIPTAEQQPRALSPIEVPLFPMRPRTIRSSSLNGLSMNPPLSSRPVSGTTGDNAFLKPPSPNTNSSFLRYQAGQFGPPTPPKDRPSTRGSGKAGYAPSDVSYETVHQSISQRRGIGHTRMYSDSAASVRTNRRADDVRRVSRASSGERLIAEMEGERGERGRKRSTIQRELAWYPRARREGFKIGEGRASVVRSEEQVERDRRRERERAAGWR